MRAFSAAFTNRPQSAKVRRQTTTDSSHNREFEMNLIKIMQAVVFAVLAAGTPASADVIKSGATATGVPFNFLDPKTNTMSGFMLDIANEVAKRGGFEFDLQTVDFASLVPALQSRRIDIITSSFSITEERSKVVDFAEPIYSFHQGLLVPAGNPKSLANYDDMKAAKIGTNIGNSAIAAGRKHDINFEQYSSIQDALRDLSLGRIDAAMVDMPIADWIMSANSDYKMEWVEGFEPFFTEYYTFSVRKGDTELLARVNPILAQIKTDGTLAELIKKWGISVQIAP
ncbi:ABC transporter substrate-binding protein [Haematobacter sp. UBA3484]|uniref:ABC transporter substrate-binding protein n=2 Tax=unclassified Haematobacter TaxID=2640585 RepID=UPI0025BB26B2|nr:ABC transporter substrate-binding protein [Haematobacter sp. UBA3484]